MEGAQTVKLYIFTDMEGVGGILQWRQVIRNEDLAAYDESCHLLAAEVNAAIDGALEAGIDKVVVWDGHAAQFNLPLDMLHPRATYVMGAPTPTLFPLIDEGVDAAFLIGYHAKAGTAAAILAHTWSPDGQVLRINGQEVGEIGLCAAYAGWYGVPVLMISGDDKACAEARSLLGDVETAVVKRGLSLHCGEITPPELCRDLIREAAKRAVAKLGIVAPLRFGPPFEVEIVYDSSDAAAKPRTTTVSGDDLACCLDTLYLGKRGS